MTQLGPIGQIAIAASELDRALTFYRDSIGLKFLFRFDPLIFFDCEIGRAHV